MTELNLFLKVIPRDNVILELEKRIHNNIKTEYDDNVFDIKKTMPGKFRTTDFDPTTVNKILEDEFLRWTNPRIPIQKTIHLMLTKSLHGITKTL